MLKIGAILLLVIGAIHALSNEHSCQGLLCKKPPEIKEFPENNEELQDICNPALEWMECEIRSAECYNDEPEAIQVGYRILALMRDICSEDTLLHAAIVDNLKCAKKLIYEEGRYCIIHGGSPDRIENFVEALSEEGLVSLTENENETRRLVRCIEMVNFAACNARQLEKVCGTIAMDAYVEIAQRAGPGTMIIGCDDAFDLLPALIRLQKLEEEKEREVVEMFRKKK